MNDFLNDLEHFIANARSENMTAQAVRTKLLELVGTLSEDNHSLEHSKFDSSISALHSILFDTKLPEALSNNIGEDPKFDYVFNTLINMRKAILAYSTGDLSFSFKSKGFVSGAMKMLQSNLNHLTWQAQMVAQGDFTQRVDFMGDFSKAFNLMIEQLDTTISTLKNSEVELIKLNATKDKFFSIISHDLRGPLWGLKNALEMMSKDFESFSKEESIEFLSLMHESSDNLFALLENLLIWSRSQRGLDEIHSERIDLYDNVKSLISLVKFNADAKSINVISTIDSDTYVFADPNQLTTIIRNLISNAIKFTPEGGTIEIGRADITSFEGFSVIYIRDSGVGMNEATLKKLFRIEASIKSVGTAGEKGTGLGLILCKEFVERNGGQIWVESEVGKGSTFYFTLPENTNNQEINYEFN